MSRFPPSRKPPTFTLEQTARLRLHLRKLWNEQGTQKKAAEVLGVPGGRVLYEIFAGGDVLPRVALRLAEHHKTTVEALLEVGP